MLGDLWRVVESEGSGTRSSPDPADPGVRMNAVAARPRPFEDLNERLVPRESDREPGLTSYDAVGWLASGTPNSIWRADSWRRTSRSLG